MTRKYYAEISWTSNHRLLAQVVLLADDLEEADKLALDAFIWGGTHPWNYTIELEDRGETAAKGQVLNIYNPVDFWSKKEFAGLDKEQRKAKLLTAFNEKQPNLETGEFYWCRHHTKQTWRIAYVGQDPEGNQYLRIFGLYLPQLIEEMDLTVFDWIMIEEPQS